jgi:hypothetical protein
MYILHAKTGRISNSAERVTNVSKTREQFEAARPTFVVRRRRRPVPKTPRPL